MQFFRTLTAGNDIPLKRRAITVIIDLLSGAEVVTRLESDPGDK